METTKLHFIGEMCKKSTNYGLPIFNLLQLIENYFEAIFNLKKTGLWNAKFHTLPCSKWIAPILWSRSWPYAEFIPNSI